MLTKNVEGTMITTEAIPMAKAKRNDVPVKMDTEVVRLARIVAAYRDIPMAEYLSERLRPLVTADLTEHQAAECRSKGGNGKPKR